MSFRGMPQGSAIVNWKGIELKALTSGIPQQIRKASAGVRKTSADITKDLSRHQERPQQISRQTPLQIR
jgi:hypothetical protein